MSPDPPLMPEFEVEESWEGARERVVEDGVGGREAQRVMLVSAVSRRVMLVSAVSSVALSVTPLCVCVCAVPRTHVQTP